MSSEARPTRGLLLMVVAPSGVGKTSLSRRLVSDHTDLQLSISNTTRAPRPGEHEGRDYHFVDRPTFQGMVGEDAFLEWAEVYGNYYGSPKAPIMEALDRGESVLFDIDYQGAMTIKGKLSDDTVLVYILPPSLAEMSRRLHTRSQDSEEVINERIGRSKDEVGQWRQFDYVLINDDFDQTYSNLAHIYHAERMRRARALWIEPFVERLMGEEI